MCFFSGTGVTRSRVLFSFILLLTYLFMSQSYAATWDNAFFRGTTNNWASTPLSINAQTGLWQTQQTFADPNPRFKITRFENWNESYPVADFLINDGPGEYVITFDDVGKNITAVKQQPTSINIAASSICFDNPAQFAAPSMYFWQPVPTGNLVLPDWPGEPMQAKGDYVCFDPIQTLTSLNIIFSDNGNNQSIDLIYTGAGCYTGNTWLSLQDCGFVTEVVENAPVAEAGPDIQVTTGTDVIFDGSGSTDSDGSIVNYSWDNGLSGVNPSLSYATAGMFTVTLTVTDNDGLTDTDSLQVNVTDPASNTVVYFENTLNYNAPHMHYFDVAPNQADSDWPGIELESLGNNWYRHDLGSAVNSSGIVFNDNGGAKTGDLVLAAGLNCYSNGQWMAVAECDIPSNISAIAGPDRSVNVNTQIVLSALASLGEYTNASWTSTAWTGTLNGVSVVSPALSQLGQHPVTLTLVNSNNESSVSEFILTVVPAEKGLAQRPLLAAPLAFPTTGSVSSGNYQFVKAFPALDGTFLASVMVLADGSNDLLYVVDKPGVIYVFPNREDVTPAEVKTVLDIQSITRDFHEQGLLSMAFDPDYINNGYIYVYYINGNNDDIKTGDNYSDAVLDRWTVSNPANPETVVVNSQVEILRIPQPGPDHKGGMMQFHPEEGYLYISVGDGAYGHSAITPFAEDPRTNNSAQQLSNLRGSMLRIEMLDNPENGFYYAIPADNPFVTDPNARDEIWSYGHRNPWRWAFDLQSPHILWQTEVGQQGYEEVNIIQKGENYGWPICEGLVNRGELGGSPNLNCASDFTPPKDGYQHTGASSIIGGFLYRGNDLPELNGEFIFGDYNSKQIWSTKQDQDKVLLSDSFPENIASFGTDLSGDALFVSTYGVDFGDGSSSIYKVVDADLEAAKIPLTLSVTGLFAVLDQQIPASGVIEYQLNSDAWFDGAKARHFMSVPNNQVIDFAQTDEWDLPVGSVLVKHLDLLLDAQGNHQAFTTSVLFKQDSGWQAANYRWNSAGTDADLVTEISVVTVQQFEASGLVNKQRTLMTSSECSACHTGSGSKDPLAVSTRQLNRLFDYQGLEDNQLDVLNHVGLLSQNIAGADTYQSFVDPADINADLGQRAQTYLDTNCAHCHSSAFMDLRVDTPLQDKNIINVTTGNSQYRVKPFDVSNSLLHIFQTTDGNRMPKGSRYTNPLADTLFTQWINALDAVMVSVELTADKPVIKSGGGLNLILRTVFNNGFTDVPQNSINWTSSNAAVLDVSSASGSNIVVTAMASGTAVITADTDGYFDDITITVEAGPVPPSNLVLTTLSASSIQLNWQDNSADESAFTVLRSLNVSGPFSPIATLAADSTSHIDNGLMAATRYYYQVLSNNPQGDSIAATGFALTAQPSNIDNLRVLPDSINLFAGDSQQLFALASENAVPIAATYEVTWSSSNSAVVSVSANGIITGGTTPGVSTITATLNGLFFDIDVQNMGAGDYVYFEKPATWPAAHIWAWTEDNGVITNQIGDVWPGAIMEKAPEFGGTWYRYPISNDVYSVNNAVNIIFNCASETCKTASLTRSQGDTNWYAGNIWLDQKPVGKGSPQGTQIQVGNGTIGLNDPAENLSGQLFTAGSIVTITADEAGAGKQFVKWEGSGAALMLNPNNPQTSMIVEDVLSLTLLAVFDSIEDTHVAARASYQSQCSGCHGSDGESGTSLVNVTSNYSLTELSLYINDFMPFGNTGNCTGDCAEGIAALIYDDAYQPPIGVCNADSLDDLIPAQRSYRLLTNLEYNNTVRDLINSNVDIDVTSGKIPPSVAVNGFFTGADTVFTNDHSKGYLLVAEAVADRVNNLFDLAPQCSDIDCFINTFGKKAFRRPLTPVEFTQLKSLYTALGERGLLVGIFASPALLYRSEVGDVINGGNNQGYYQLTPYEVASLLSYTYWATTPDSDLIAAADAAELNTAMQISQQVQRLLADDRAQQAFERFIDGWLDLKHPVAANIDENLKADMKQETYEFVKSVVFGGGSYDELLTADYSYMTQALATHYGLPWPGGSNVQEVSYLGNSDGRAGLLAHGSILAGQSTSESTHPIKRGLFVRRNLLCQDFPPPPVGADLSPVIDPTHTVRERYESHQQPSCNSCHQYIDGIGFGLESFDNKGIFRTQETTADGAVRAIDSSGNISSLNSAETFLSESEPSEAFSQLAELATLIAQSRNGRACYVRQLYRYTQGKREDETDSCTLEVMGKTFKQDPNSSLLNLMIEMSQSKNYILRK